MAERQCRCVELYHVCPGGYPFKVILTILVGDNKRAVLQPDPSISKTFPVRILTSAFPHLSNDKRCVSEELISHQHISKGTACRSHAYAGQRSAVTSHSRFCSSRHFRHVTHFARLARTKLPKAYPQFPTIATDHYERVRLPYTVDGKRTLRKTEALRQSVYNFSSRYCFRNAAVLNGYLILQKVANRGHFTTCLLGDKHIDRHRIQRNIKGRRFT